MTTPLGSQFGFGQTNNASTIPLAQSRPFGNSNPFSSSSGSSVFCAFGQPSTTSFGASTSACVTSLNSTIGLSASFSGGSTWFGQNPNFGGFGSTPSGSTLQQTQPTLGSNAFGSTKPFGALNQPTFGPNSNPGFLTLSTPAFASTSIPTFGATTRGTGWPKIVCVCCKGEGHLFFDCPWNLRERAMPCPPSIMDPYKSQGSEKGLGKIISQCSPLFVPYTEASIREKDRLAKTLGVLVLGSGDNNPDGAIEALRSMTNAYKTWDWDPIQCGSKEFIIEFPNENALNHMFSRSSWPCRDGASYFHVNRWNGEEGMPEYRFPLQVWLGVGGMPLQNWGRDDFIRITEEFGQLLDVDPRTITKSDKRQARIKIGCTGEEVIPTYRAVVVGDRKCNISFKIISRMAFDGSIYYSVEEKEREQSKRMEENEREQAKRMEEKERVQLKCAEEKEQLKRMKKERKNEARKRRKTEARAAAKVAAEEVKQTAEAAKLLSLRESVLREEIEKIAAAVALTEAKLQAAKFSAVGARVPASVSPAQNALIIGASSSQQPGTLTVGKRTIQGIDGEHEGTGDGESGCRRIEELELGLVRRSNGDKDGGQITIHDSDFPDLGWVSRNPTQLKAAEDLNFEGSILRGSAQAHVQRDYISFNTRPNVEKTGSGRSIGPEEERGQPCSVELGAEFAKRKVEGLSELGMGIEMGVKNIKETIGLDEETQLVKEQQGGTNGKGKEVASEGHNDIAKVWEQTMAPNKMHPAFERVMERKVEKMMGAARVDRSAEPVRIMTLDFDSVKDKQDDIEEKEEREPIQDDEHSQGEEEAIEAQTAAEARPHCRASAPCS